MANMAAEMVLYEQRRTNARYLYLCQEKAARQRRKEVERRAREESVDFKTMLAALETKLKQKKTQKALKQKMTAIEQARKRRRKGRGKTSHRKRQRLRKETYNFSEFEDEALKNETLNDETPLKEASSSNENFTVGLKLIDELMKNRYLSAPFCEPVDWEALEIPDYPEKIKNPMDLGTIRKKILESRYDMLGEIWTDIDLVWDNCRIYNGPYNPITIKANALSEVVKARQAEYSASSRLKREIANTIFRKQRKMRTKSIDGNGSQEENESQAQEAQNVVDISPQQGVGANVEDGGDQVDPKSSESGTVKRTYYLRNANKKSAKIEHTVGTAEEQHVTSRPGTGTTVERQMKTEIPRLEASSNPRKRWSSKLGDLSVKMELFEVDSDEDAYSSSSSSEDDNENLFELVKQVAPFNTTNCGPSSTAGKQGTTVKTSKPGATMIKKERVVSQNAIDQTGKNATMASEKVLATCDNSLWSTFTNDVSAGVVATVVKKYSPIFIEDAQASPEPYLIPCKSPEPSPPIENVVHKSSSELLQVTKSRACGTDSDLLSNKQQDGKPEKKVGDTEFFNHFEQADMLDDLFS